MQVDGCAGHGCTLAHALGYETLARVRASERTVDYSREGYTLLVVWHRHLHHWVLLLVLEEESALCPAGQGLLGALLMMGGLLRGVRPCDCDRQGPENR